MPHHPCSSYLFPKNFINIPYILKIWSLCTITTSLTNSVFVLPWPALASLHLPPDQPGAPLHVGGQVLRYLVPKVKVSTEFLQYSKKAPSKVL